MLLIDYSISTTNIVIFQRPTNAFRGVVEQIYIKLDSQQDFRGNTPMKHSNTPLFLPFSQFYTLNQIICSKFEKLPIYS
mgnify:CR=1 FL=1